MSMFMGMNQIAMLMFMNMKTSENELDILNIFRKLDDAENNIREEKVFEAQTSLAVLRAKYGI